MKQMVFSQAFSLQLEIVTKSLYVSITQGWAHGRLWDLSMEPEFIHFIGESCESKKMSTFIKILHDRFQNNPIRQSQVDKISPDQNERLI